MRDVFLRVIVVLAVMLACISSTPGQSAPKTKTDKTDSAFEQLDKSVLLQKLDKFSMPRLAEKISLDTNKPADVLVMVRLQANAMRQINDPVQRLTVGKGLIKTLENTIDLAEKDKAAAEKKAEETRAQGRAKTNILLEAARAGITYFDTLYLLGDMAGRQAVGGYAGRMMQLQANREDRKTILQMTEGAVMDLDDMQNELQATLRDWQDDMSVWMIMGGKGERLLRDAKYWSTNTYLNRAMALGDDEAYESERAELQGAYRAAAAKISADQADRRKELKAKLDTAAAKLAVSQKKRTALRRELLGRVMRILPAFESAKRFSVSHEARLMMAQASRELGNFDDAIKYLAPQRYAGASPATNMNVSMELPITLAKQGKYSEAAQAITRFKGFAEMTIGRGKPLKDLQQAQIDLKVAILKEYLARRQAATSTTPAERARHNSAASGALIEFLDKYESDNIRQSFIDFFGNRLRYAQDVDSLTSMQLYIVARGAVGEKDPGKRKVILSKRQAMLETFLGRKKDPVVKKLAPEAHWQLAMTLNELGRQKDAADNFVSVLTLDGPDNPRSPRAAQNASICMEQYVKWYAKNHRQSLPRSVRLKFVAALQHAVSFDTKKNADLKLSKWYYSLGANCDRLAKGSADKEKVIWMRKAADAFGKVPSDPPGIYFNAQELWLDLRFRALAGAKMDAKATSETVKLRSDYELFIQRVEKYIAAMADKTSPEAQGLTESSAWADFARAKLLSDKLQKKTEALLEIEALLKKWAEVKNVVLSASQWKIQNLIDQGKIAEASAELEKFLKDNEKNPDAGGNLIEQVIEGIRKAIGQVQAKGGDEAKLASYRKSYLQLAARLYAPIKGKPIEDPTTNKVNEESLTLTQLWIDALVQNDKGVEAMKLAVECRRIFNKGRDAEAKKVEAMFAAKIAKCKAAVGLPVALQRLVTVFLTDLKTHKIDDAADVARPVLMAQKALQLAIKSKGPAPKRKRLMDALSMELETGYREIIRILKGRIPVDLNIEWNVAKCLAATEKYNDSLLIYVRLIKGTDPRVGKDMARRFWRLQLEYCQTFIKAFSEEKERMGKIMEYIEKELPKNGNDLGGFQAEFFSLRKQAKRLSE